jgi:hypothetical protein
VSQSAARAPRDDNRETKLGRRDAPGNSAGTSRRRLGEIFDEPVASVTGRNFFSPPPPPPSPPPPPPPPPPDIPGDINCARGEAAGAKLPSLNPFSDVLEFAGGKFESLPGRLSRGSHSIRYARFLPRGEDKNFRITAARTQGHRDSSSNYRRISRYR